MKWVFIVVLPLLTNCNPGKEIAGGGRQIRFDPQRQPDNCETVSLFRAIEGRCQETALELLTFGAEVNTSRESNPDRPVHYAAREDMPELLKELVIHEHSRGTNVAGLRERTPLHYAALFGRLKNIEYLVQLVDLKVNLQDRDGLTAMHFAAGEGHLDVVELLVKQEVDITLQDEDGYTSFMSAVVKHDEESPGSSRMDIIRVLYDKNNDVITIPDKNNRTPLMVAESSTHKKELRAWLEDRLK